MQEQFPQWQVPYEPLSPFDNFYLNIQLLSDNAKMPTRATDGDAGLDLYSPGDYEFLSDVLIPLDIRVEFPKGFAMIIKEKSGVATKLKLHVGACVIDSGYRGNCHVHLFSNPTETEVKTHNHTLLSLAASFQHIKIQKHQKIAQAIIVPVWTGQPRLVNEISTDTARSTGGFGSTGKF